MEDVIRVIAITLETLLEDEENQIRHAMDWFPSFHVLLFRGLSCIVDASNLSLAHMTFWNPIEVQSLKSWSQRHHWLIAVEASDQPVRDEHSHEAQGDQLHPPALLCQHHVQLCQGNPQQEDSEQVIFLLLSKVYSQPTGVKSKQTSQYPGSTFTRLWESWKRELAELKFFRKNMEAPFQFSRWLGGYLKQFELTFSN